ncbi:hypothetical protein KIW84_021121 [Lathyrus oleraceus]|uniref:Retrovirus-related Pol polyprotein from transposon TNT 1-94-like beta-barrel domain-containing protein n=1 Tax=Pisum sativum TaxID=3888 RepID=A0A9D4Y995_PEA|nr:hypothetical protein KIW84_021121 [Pisum sativum]
MAVSSSSGSTKIKFDDVRDLVLSEEIRRRELGESSSSSVLHTEERIQPGDMDVKEFFNNHVSGNLGKAYLGNEKSYEIVGKGVMKIKLGGSEWELKNVRHIPDLTKNLISVGQLASEGYTTVFHGDQWKISKGAMTVARDRHNTSTNESKLNDPVYAEVDDIPESPIIENPQLEESTEQRSEQQYDASETCTPTSILRKSFRPHVPNRRYMDYMLLTDGGEPEDYAEACQTTDARDLLEELLWGGNWIRFKSKLFKNIYSWE